MMLGLFLTCFVALLIATTLLLIAGHRIHRSSSIVGWLLIVGLALGAGTISTRSSNSLSRTMIRAIRA